MTRHPSELANVRSPLAGDRLSYRVAEAALLSGLSRTTIYELIAAGKIRDVKVAGCRIVPAQDLLRLVTGEVADA
jgi:excisionase family DNA binding protein